MHEFNTEERRNDNTNLKPPTMEVEPDTIYDDDIKRKTTIQPPTTEVETIEK